MQDPIQRAIEAAGGITKLARALGITHAAVWHWKKIPPEHCLEIERLTGIPRYELNPKIYGEKP